MNQLSKEVQIILDSISDGLFTVDKNFKITYFNKAAEKITGIPKHEAIGKSCNQVFKANICEKECALRETIQTGNPVIGKTIWIMTLTGEKIPISISTAILKNEKKQFIGGVETFRDLSQIEKLKSELQGKFTLFDIVSKNKKIIEIFDILPEIAESNSNVLIEGPNGSGKELFARAIHNLSPRKEGPFVAVNLSALPDNLLESELFGYKKGAFTGAVKDKLGRLAIAQGGTLFIDEIGEISLSFQVKLLRIIQEKEFEPLGAEQKEKADVRFIFASNKNLYNLIDKGIFREDLYYRINVIKISLPPLKERMEDIPFLVNYFITHFNKINNKNIQGIDHEALNILMHYSYQGNIRELRNIVEHCFVLCKEDLIQLKHFPSYILDKMKINYSPVDKTLKSAEKQIIIESLKRNKNRKDITARELGIDSSTLWRKIKKYNINK
ncbi:MAG: sigma 54-interacting transcriptional regulator [Spirochaetes bacterium]|nr:sigma 54-interacting transcriptional regulator [Spirochaetota bacterium]